MKKRQCNDCNTWHGEEHLISAPHAGIGEYCYDCYFIRSVEGGTRMTPYKDAMDYLNMQGFKNFYQFFKSKNKLNQYRTEYDEGH